MKSFFGFLLALLVSGALSVQAQTTQPMSSGASSASSSKMMKEGKMKKEGTMSSKSKMMAPGAGPMKKDGTPDMRYKANRMAKGKM